VDADDVAAQRVKFVAALEEIQAQLRDQGFEEAPQAFGVLLGYYLRACGVAGGGENVPLRRKLERDYPAFPTILALGDRDALLHNAGLAWDRYRQDLVLAFTASQRKLNHEALDFNVARGGRARESRRRSVSASPRRARAPARPEPSPSPDLARSPGGAAW
jgi:hypothetical protein